MYFKVDRKVLKKALVWLKKQSYALSNEHPVEVIFIPDYYEYIKQVEFALYKTKMNDFYIDYDFAQAIRPALLTKEKSK